jgi:hypothetical protein
LLKVFETGFRFSAHIDRMNGEAPKLAMVAKGVSSPAWTSTT